MYDSDVSNLKTVHPNNIMKNATFEHRVSGIGGKSLKIYIFFISTIGEAHAALIEGSRSDGRILITRRSLNSAQTTPFFCRGCDIASNNSYCIVVGATTNCLLCLLRRKRKHFSAWPPCPTQCYCGWSSKCRFQAARA